MPDETTIEPVKLQFSPAVFDPNKESLHAIAAEVALITADPSKMTKEDFELVNSTKNKLVKARTTIQKRGKELREDAVKYQRDVIGYEKELIAIIEPEEQRLKEIEAAAKEYAMTEERKKTLPEFKEKLASIGDDVAEMHEPDYDAFLLTLDPNGRTEYYNERLGAKLEAQKAADEERRRKEDEERAAKEAELAREAERIESEKKLAAEREWSARTSRILGLGFVDSGEQFTFEEVFIHKGQAREMSSEKFEELLSATIPTIAKIKKRIADEAEAKRAEEVKQAQEQAAQAERERLQKEEQERKEADEKKAAEEKAEEEKRQRAEAFQKFLSENSYNEATDTLIMGEDRVTTLYRTVAKYQHPIV